MIYLQDNAPVHTARVSRDTIHAYDIATIDLPPYSPDLNLIKQVWSWMKNWIEARWGTARVGLEDIRYRVLAAWQALPSDHLQRLIESMPRRLQQVIDRNGGETTY